MVRDSRFDVSAGTKKIINSIDKTKICRLV